MASSTGTTETIALPLSIGQQHIWAGQQLDPSSPLYNMALVSSIQGAIDPIRFDAVWQKVQREYDSLSSHIGLDAGETVQVVGTQTCALEVVNLSSEADPESALNEFVQERCERSLDCAQQLHDAVLIKTGLNQWAWYCNIHHIVSDAASFGVLFQRLAHYYFALPAELTNPASAATTAAVTSTTPETAPSAESMSHWRERAAPSLLPFYGNSPSSATTRSTRTDVPLPIKHQQAIQQLCELPQARTFGASLSQYIVIATSLIAYLHRISGQTEISIGTLVPSKAGSQFTDAAHNSLGLNVQLLPLHVHVNDSDSFTALMSRVREEITQCMRYAYDGANQMVAMSDLSVVLNFTTTSLGQFGEMPATHRWLHPAHSDRNHAIRMHVTDWSGTGALHVAFDHNNEQFSDQARQNALAHWRQCTDAMLDDPGKAIGSVELADIVIANARRPVTDKIYPNVLTVIDRIADANINDNAVSQGDQQVSYQALSETSHAIAQYLRERGIGRGDSRCSAHASQP